jgi:hypothetical protein
MIAHGRIPETGRTVLARWLETETARCRLEAYDAQLDGIDLELEGLARIRCEDYCASLRERGYDVSGIRPLVARPWESRTERRELARMRAVEGMQYARQGPGWGRVLVRHRTGEVLGVS